MTSQTLLQTFHKRFYTQTLLHTLALRHRHFYTQTRLHTDPFTHRRLYTQKLLLTEAFTHRSFYTRTDLFTHKHFDTHFHTDAFTHRSFYSQKLLHFTQRTLAAEELLHGVACTQKSLHSGIFTHESVYTHKLLPKKCITHPKSFTRVSKQRRFYLHAVTLAQRSLCTDSSYHFSRPQFVTLVTSKCASRHNNMHFFHIATSKCSENGVFRTFWLETCFAPQPRAAFRHLNIQKWSEHVLFWHFSLEACFAPQQRAIFNLSSGQLAPHPPLYRAYFSTLRSHKS